MAVRRIFLADLRPGLLALPEAAAHHLTAVLRLDVGAPVTVFNTTGHTADAVLVRLPAGPTAADSAARETAAAWAVQVGDLRDPPVRHLLTIASAVPKGDRADWLVEKLAEVGAAAWTPLRTERSVVHPDGTAKRERWQRIASEAARQSAAPSVLTVGEVTTLATLASTTAVAAGKVAWFCSTEVGALPAREAPCPDMIFIGPEGGWSPAEEEALLAAGAVAVSLGRTVLRVETAAVLAAAFALQMRC